MIVIKYICLFIYLFSIYFLEVMIYFEKVLDLLLGWLLESLRNNDIGFFISLNIL